MNNSASAAKVGHPVVNRISGLKRGAYLAAAALLLSGVCAQGATLFWDGGTTNMEANGDGGSQGGTGTWDLVTLNWDAGAGVPHVAWTNANADSAVFGGTAGFVTLGADVAAGGLRFDSTGYNFSNGTFMLSFEGAATPLILNNVAAATIGGTVGGTGAVAMSAANLGVAGTLTFRGVNTNGWSGATTVGPGLSVIVDNNSGTNRALMNTGAITLNGGSLVVQNVLAPHAGVDFINDNAPITINGGGTLGWRPINAGPTFVETNGAVTVNNGQAVFLTGSISSGTSTLVMPGITRNDVSSVLVFSLGNGNPVTSVNRFRINGAGTTAGWTNGAASNPIIGPWATSGSGGSSDYVIYDNDLVAVANVAASDESTWADAALAYTVTNGATLTTNRTALALRTIGNAQTLNLGGFNLETYGVLVGGAAVVVTNGVLTTPVGGGAGTTNDLFLTTGSANLTNYSTLADNGAAVRVVKSGGSTLTLAGGNSFSGGLTINGGTTVLSATNSMAGGITVFSGGTLQLGSGGTDPMLGAAGNGVSLNGGFFNIASANLSCSRDVAVLSLGGSIQVSKNNTLSTSGRLTGSGALTLRNPGGSGNQPAYLFNSTSNDFTGPLLFISGTAFTCASFADSTNNIVFAFNSDTASTFTYSTGAVAALTLASRAIEINAPTGFAVTIANNSTNHRIAVLKDLLATGGGAKTLALNAAGATPTNLFAGNISNGTGGGSLAVTRSQGIWALFGTNTYSGSTTIGGGTLIINSIADYGLPSSVGVGTAGVEIKVGGNGSQVPTLTYVGGPATTDRQIMIGYSGNNSGGQLFNNGTGPLTFTASVFNKNPGGGFTRTMTLGGTYDGAANEIQGVIANTNVIGTNDVLSISKAADASIWKFSGANTYTGSTTISGGVLDAVEGIGLPVNSLLQIRGGVLQSSGTFSRNVTTAGGGVNWSTSSGGFAARGGALTLQLNGGTGSLTWNGSSFVATGQTLIFGSTLADGLVDFQNALNLGSSASGQRTIRVNDNTNSTADRARISGAIANTAAGWGILKTGDGILELTADCTYSGPTTVSNGTLILNGSIGTGAVTLAAATLLGGTGTIGGTVTSAGTVAPGESIGQLSIGGNYTQTGTLNIELGSGSNDLLQITGTAQLGGTLNVSLISGYVPQTNDFFVILVAGGGVTDSFAVTNLPSPGGGKAWDLQNVGNALILTVIAAGGPPPPTGYDAFSNNFVLVNGPDGDDDGDGFANLYEYVTGSSPTNSGSGNALTAVRTNGTFALKFLRDTNTVDATLVVEGAYAAANDATWIGFATNINGSWGSATNVIEDANSPANVTAFDTEPAATNRFLRLRVTRP